MNWQPLLEEATTWLQGRPGWLFFALVLVPGLPLPASLLFATAGLVWREQPWLACLVCLAALALNQTWTYGVAAGPGRRVAGSLLARFDRKLPEKQRVNETDWILIVRLTPGLPLFVQNYYLGFIRVGFLRYLGVSLLCSGPIMTGVVLSAAGVADGRWKTVIFGVGVLVFGGVLIRLLRRRILRTRSVAEEKTC